MEVMSSPHQHHPVYGIFFALAAAIMLSSMNMFAKLLGDVLGPVEITFARNFIAIALLLMGLSALKKLSLIRTKRPWAQLIRACVGTIGMIFSMWAVIVLPLTTATALLFTAPLFVVLLSYPLLKEKVGPFRLIAALIGFSGVLIIAQPETDIPLSSLLIGLIAGFLNGLVAICLRWLGNTESTATTNFYFLFYGLIGTACILPFLPSETPDQSSWPYILGLGIVGLLSLLLKTQGFRLGPAALISPISYTMMVWAMIYDYFIWNNIPSALILTGAGVIISSNLFILWREHTKQTKKDRKHV